MPAKTRLLDEGNFVVSPRTSVNEAFARYLAGFDIVFAAWQGAYDQWSQSHFAAEFLDRKRQLDAEMDRFLQPFRERYTLRSAQQDPSLLTAAAFFAEFHPIEQPFSVLHCDANIPLHTVARFSEGAELAAVNAALAEDVPLRWWQKGPLGHPCYLFGQSVWELKTSELHSSDKGLRLLFEEAVAADRRKRDRLQHEHVCSALTSDADFIPERIRVAVWRRGGGRCAQCGGREGLDFDYIRPAGQGGAATPENLRVLCARCREQKLQTAAGSARRW